MTEEAKTPFREKSLERLSSPERLDQVLRVIDRKTWLPLAALGGLVLTLLLWAILAKIPIYVEGRGLLVRPRQVVNLYAPGAGYVTRIDVRPGDPVRSGQVLGVIARRELETRLELQRAKIRELTALSRAAEILRLRSELSPRAGELQRDSLEQHIESAHDLAVQLRDKELEALAEERKRLQVQWDTARRLPAALEQQLARLEQLHREQILSDEALLEARQKHVDSLARVSDLDRKLRELRTQELEVQDRFMSRLQRLADLTFELEGYEQQILDANREIRRLEAELEEDTRIVSEHDATVLELTAAVGEFVTPSNVVGTLLLSSDAPLKSVTYFTVRDGKRIAERHARRAGGHDGMVIFVTPDTVERERYGSIQATVEEVSDYPVTAAEAESVVGNRRLADTLLAGDRLMQVVAELVPDEDTESKYRWSSSKGPNMTFSSGTTTTARAVVERRPPITFVLPFLKSSVGID